MLLWGKDLEESAHTADESDFDRVKTSGERGFTGHGVAAQPEICPISSGLEPNGVVTDVNGTASVEAVVDHLCPSGRAAGVWH